MTFNPLRNFRSNLVICWLIILGTIGFVAVGVARTPPTVSKQIGNLQLRISSQVAVGTKAVQDSIGTASKSDAAKVMLGVDAAARTRHDKICAAVVAGEIVGPKDALARLSKIDPRDDLDMRADLASLHTIYENGLDSIDAAQREQLRTRYEWFGRLAIASQRGPGDALRDEAIAPARTIFLMLTLLGLLFIAVALSGLVLLIVAIALTMNRKMHWAFGPVITIPRGLPPVFLEAFAIYILGFILFGEILTRIIHAHSIAWYFLSTALLPLVLAWPVMRGLSWREVRVAFGWHGGRNVFIEPLWGILGYIAGIPVLAVGFLISALLSKFASASPTHPIINQLHGSSVHITMLYALACLWAPLMEETMFRGALYNHLRGKWNWMFSSLIVGVLFALVHPQGWTFIPVLGAIGMILCWIREWRGSIIGCMTAHAMINAISLTIAMKLLA